MNDRRIRVAINTRFLIHGKLEGIGWYTYEISKRLVALYPQYDFYFFFDRPFNEEYIFADNVFPIVLTPQARHPFLWFVWFERSVKNALEEYEIDVFFSPDSFLSLGSEVPTLITSHDLAYIHYPKQVPYLVRKYYETYFPKYHEKASLITAVSKATKRDIIKNYDVGAEKITVASNACRDNFKPVDDEIKSKVRTQYTEGKPYFVYLGSIHPRKNVHNLIHAFDQFKADTGSDLKLVIIGRKAWKNNAFESALKKSPYKEDIVFEEDLKDEVYAVVASAIAMVYVSYFEGFGLPILEAMSCGVPVICSNSSSMPEVARDAAILVNPKKNKHIAYAMKNISNDEILRNNLIEKGFKQAKKFDWGQSAATIGQLIEQLINLPKESYDDQVV